MTELYTIYKIYSKDNKYIYVGSTIDFKKRKRDHKYNCYNENGKAYNYLLYKTIRENGEWEDFKIEKIEELICGLETALVRENELMKQLNCNLNEKRAIRTLEEKKQYEKKYKNMKNNCDCGGSYSTKHRAKHFKTDKHLKYEHQMINNITYNITNLTINNK